MVHGPISYYIVVTQCLFVDYRYQSAAVCYAYLHDVENTDISQNSEFSRSAWWTRGWTLQELIAPANVEFYNSGWERIGTKKSMPQRIRQITGISIQALLGQRLDSFSVAMKMSWASKRTTTRVEDVAYSLLGIFEVNMPLLYGEGSRAFTRLQEEILKQSDDQSLFVWSCADADSDSRGLLAKSPAAFSHCSNFIRSSSKLAKSPYSVTNMGLSIELYMNPWAMEIYFAALDCEIEGIPNS